MLINETKFWNCHFQITIGSNVGIGSTLFADGVDTGESVVGRCNNS